MNILLYFLLKCGVDLYIIVCYEELVRSIFVFVCKIFEFIGIDFVLEVKEWFWRNRLFDKNGSSDSEWSYFISNRNIIVIINVWREGLIFFEIFLIDKECVYFM